MLELTLGEQTYRLSKLSAFQQLHLSRRIAPLLPKLLPAFVALAGREQAGEGEQKQQLDLPALASAMGPLADALAGMSDADCEYVFSVCLSGVARLQGTAWASVWNTPTRSLMFDDIDLASMTQLVVRVITDNLAPFISGLLAQLPAASKSPAIAA